MTHSDVISTATTSFDYVFNEIIGIENGIVEIYVQPETLVRFLKAAQRKNFGNGEYVFIYLLPFGVFPYQFEKGKPQAEILHGKNGVEKLIDNDR